MHQLLGCQTLSEVFVYITGLYSLEGKNQYPALQRKENHNSNPFGSKNMYSCYAACFPVS